MKQKYNSSVKNSLDSIREVTDMLMCYMRSSNITINTYALDCLFDVYTEEDYNVILAEKNILELL